MSKQNILVTGINGFIGKALINGLDRQRYDVYALDDTTPENLNDLQIAEFFLQDLTARFTLHISFDYIIHLAALNVTHVGKAEYRDYHRVNVQGTENLIKHVKTKKFIFMSTVKVYRPQDGLINEDHPVKPQGDYERSKLEAEILCQRYFDANDLIIVRAVNVVGPGQAQKAVFPLFFQQALNNEPLKLIYPAGTSLQMLDVDDLLRALYLLLEKGWGLGVVNLCPSETVTLGKLAEEIIALCGSKSSIDTVRGNERELPVTKFVSKKANAMLGWEARASVQDILRKYYKFISMHQ